ncbi:MAG: hypothetical protein JXO22_07050, partial [Phycisphaerae bacterium]|nr:hypothetical protein [Phycisphaerae bacterium]
SDTLFRLGETMERCGYTPDLFAPIMQAAGETAGVTPNVWDICVAILMKERYEEEVDGQKTIKFAEMTPEQVEKIKREWGWVTQMVYGASGGHFQLNTHFVEVPNDVDVPYATHGGWLRGPTDAFVPVRGTYDGCMSFRPRGPSVTGGADCGPNGSAMVDIGTWCGWEVYLHEWNHSFDWTRNTDEAGDGYPITHHSDGCGHQPIASMGYGHRSSMRYWVTPAMYHRMEAADPDSGVGYVRNWWIGTRHEITETPPENDIPSHHVLDYDWRAAGDEHRFLAADSDFIDLNAFYADDSAMKPGTWCVAHARSAICSPERQEVRLWLGHNDGMALWVNDELIHRGDYFAIAKFEDQNWPNMVAVAVVLQEGWNVIDAVVESWPAPRDKGYGFSVRVCDADNQPVSGLKFAAASTALPKVAPIDPLRPKFGRYYTWDDVRDDYYCKLPRIIGDDLRAYFGLPESASVTVTSDIGPTTGYVAVAATADQPSDTLLPIPAKWNRETDADTRLNNIMDYNREAIAVYPFSREGTDRHLLIMRPEAIDAYLTCLHEDPSAARVYGDRPVRQRMLGYFQTGTNNGEQEGVRVWLVAETILPTPLPFDEEDLLSPLP